MISGHVTVVKEEMVKAGPCQGQGHMGHGLKRKNYEGAKFRIQPNRIIINSVMRAPAVKVAIVPSFYYCKTLLNTFESS
jgi:hypothetical protein